MTAQTNEPSVKVETITPRRAEQLLRESNIGNRKLHPGRVETYARDMLDGNWIFNGDPLRFNGDERLYDGQHRLAAVAKSGKPQKFTTIRGLTEEAHATIDVGMSRTMAQELAWRSVPHAALVASILNLVWQYDTETLLDPQVNSSRRELLALFIAEPQIVDLGTEVAHITQRTKIRGSALGAAVHLFCREHGERGHEFLEALDAGTNYQDGDPCLLLRQYATKVAGARSVRPTGVEWLAITIKAGNYWLAGTPMRTLKWARLGSNREAFPTVIAREELPEVGEE